MNKNTIKQKISALSKVLTSERSKSAIQTLIEELDKVEVKSDLTQPVAHFELPKVVKDKSHAFALFTDGACRGNPGPGAYGFLIQTYDGKVLKEEAGVTEQTTNNKMELTAIIMGLKYLKKQVSPMNEIYVYTDSKYVVDGMRSWIHNWKKRGWKKADNKVPENVDLWQQLDELATICTVQFNWVKGHAGHPQNEHVDKLANIILDESGY